MDDVGDAPMFHILIVPSAEAVAKDPGGGV
jgi:hypothetical protein